MFKILITFILLCSLAQSSSLDASYRGCPSFSDYRYRNGSCLSTCPSPYEESFRADAYFCDATCPGAYYYEEEGACLKFCQPKFIREKDNIAYCDQPSSETPNGCSKSNSFRYLNGSCFSSCKYPYRSEWSWGALLCVPDIFNGQYFNIFTERILLSCEAKYVRYQHNLYYCDLPPNSNNTNYANGCPFPNDYKHFNGSCVSSCPSPFKAIKSNGANFCNLTCPAGQYINTWNQSCISTCKSGLIRYDGDVVFCDNPAVNMTTCADPYQFRYGDGSCKYSCPSPNWISQRNGASFCNAPCPNGQYIYLNSTCIETCDFEDFIVSFEDGMNFCKEMPGAQNCKIDEHLNGSKTTNCKDRSKHCPYGYFVFADYSCNQICPEGYWAFENATCSYPCGLSTSALYPSGSCLETCVSGYIQQMEGNQIVCVRDNTTNSTDNNGGISYSATIEIYLRYDIPLKVFNSGGYLAKFITMMAKLLDVSESDIKIRRIREGSTIIESEVVLTAGSFEDTKSKAMTVNQKLNDAAKAKALDFEGVGVLDNDFNTVTPDTTGKDQGKVEEDKSSSKIVIIAAGVGAAVVAVVGAFVAFKVFKYKKHQKELKIKENQRRMKAKAKPNRDLESGPQRTQQTQSERGHLKANVVKNQGYNQTNPRGKPRGPDVYRQKKSMGQIMKNIH